jgi:pSer/pThr/pTyr-binding forkhead associated (FHA) protein
MGFRDKATRLEKLIERRLTGPSADVAPEPLELARAVLDDVQDHIVPVPGGRMTFPHGDVLVHVVAAPGVRPRWKTTLEGPSGLQKSVASLLERAGCEQAATVKLRYVDDRDESWTNRWFHIEYRARRMPQISAETGIPRVQLTVVKGAAARRRYLFQVTRINIGRSAEVLSATQSVLRRNDVAFLDEKTEKESQTVSRIHAHIVYRASESGFWVHDDNSSKGTRIVRDGAMLTVPKGSARGARLQSGDEIQIGDAVLRFLVVEEAARSNRRRPRGTPGADAQGGCS